MVANHGIRLFDYDKIFLIQQHHLKLFPGILHPASLQFF